MLSSAADPLPGGEQHVHLTAGLGASTSLASLIRLSVLLPIAIDHDHVVAVTFGERDVFGDGPHPVGVGDGGAAVLLDDQGHG